MGMRDDRVDRDVLLSIRWALVSRNMNQFALQAMSSFIVMTRWLRPAVVVIGLVYG